MNSKILRKINRHADYLLLDWLRTLVSEEEYSKITIKNFRQFLPDVNYFYADNSLRLSFYSVKWTRKIIKKLVALGKSLEDITIEDLEAYSKRKVNEY